MIRKHYDKILLVGALVLLLAIFGYAAFSPDAQPATVDIPALRPTNTFTVSDVPELDLTIPELEQPPAQSSGPEWVFDLFTPPVILFDTATQSFVLLSDPTPSANFGVELVGIEDQLYRVQLFGYFGSGENLMVTLENMETGEQVLAQDGQEYANFGIEVRSVRVEDIQVDHGGQTSVAYPVAFVVLYDERLGEEVTLRSDERKRDSEPTAEFQATDDPTQTFRARMGESFEVANTIYRVEAISPPASAIVTRIEEGDEALAQTKTLRVTQTAALPANGSSPQPLNPLNQGAPTSSNPN